MLENETALISRSVTSQEKVEKAEEIEKVYGVSVLVSGLTS